MAVPGLKAEQPVSVCLCRRKNRLLVSVRGQPTVVPAVLGTGILCFVPTFGEERHFVSDDSFFLSAAPSESVWEKTDNAIGAECYGEAEY